MGWSGGSGLFSDIMEVIEEYVDSYDDKIEAYKALINSFEALDWDSQQECLGESEAYDAALKELHEDWFIEEVEYDE